MMKAIRKLWLPTLAVCLLAVLLLTSGGSVNAAEEDAAPGTSGDPLVTLSYLRDVFTDHISSLFRDELTKQTDALQTEVEARLQPLEAAAQAAQEQEERNGYQVISLEDGQRLVCQRGTELLLRVGTAFVRAEDTPGLVDLSATENLEDGDPLTKNHLCMVTINEHGIRADGHVKILVRGSYTIS